MKVKILCISHDWKIKKRPVGSADEKSKKEKFLNKTTNMADGRLSLQCHSIAYTL